MKLPFTRKNIMKCVKFWVDNNQKFGGYQQLKIFCDLFDYILNSNALSVINSQKFTNIIEKKLLELGKKDINCEYNPSVWVPEIYKKLFTKYSRIL